MKTVVTLTSWKNRIKYLYNFIYIFYKTQKELPDIFYVWLSTDEFPNKEKDLDEKLLNFIQTKNIQLKWIKENTRQFKRWNVYPEHYEDIVISLDDDRIYPFDLIETAKKVKQGTILNLYYGGECGQYTSLNWICAQCIIPANTMPTEMWQDKYKILIKECNLHSDEAYIQPFVDLNNIKIEHSLKFTHLPVLDSYFEENKINSLCLEKKRNNISQINEYKMFRQHLIDHYGLNIINTI